MNGDPLGNGVDGIMLTGDFDYIGDNGIGNVIANNGRNGIFVRGSGAQNNRIRFNSIYNNGALGIDLTADTTNPIEPDGVTANDCDDADGLANKLQNYPILTTPVFHQNGTVTVGGAFGSEFNKTYTIDFYSNNSPDPTNYGEGQIWIGSKSVTTDGDGKAAFIFTSTVQVAAGSKITATATDPDNNTSEFSCFAGECSVLGRAAGETEPDDAMRIAGGGCSLGFIVNINGDQSDPNPADGICDVDLGTTGQQCSLRAAIETTNALSGTDFVTFDIPGGGVQTIVAASVLPPITEKVFINATTQPGYSGSPLIEFRGMGVPDSYGLGLAPGSDGSLIKGMAINRFYNNIAIVSSNNSVESCYIGLRADGTVGGPAGEQTAGINIQGAAATGNEIGSELAEAGNVISGNIVGVVIALDASGNNIRSNRIGTNPDFTDDIPNGFGVLLSDANSNTVGALGNSESGGNVISGNGYGLVIDQNAESNLVNKNIVGLGDGPGESAIPLPNIAHGIFLKRGATENTIFNNWVGGHTSNSTSTGILIDADAGPDNKIQANNVGIWGAAHQDVGNNYGITVFDDEQTIELNVIGFNNEAGIFISGVPDSPNPTIESIDIKLNYVGVTPAHSAIPNDIYGIRINGDVKTSTVTHNTIGNQPFTGLALTDGPSLNTIEGNAIGTALNNSIHPNGLGMWLRNASDNTVKENIVQSNDIGMIIGTNIGFEGSLTEQFRKASEKLNGVPGQYTTGNKVFGNIISKSKIGLAVGEHSRNNNIGSPVAGELPNVITECTSTVGYGLLLGTINASVTEDEMPQGNFVQNNLIGATGNPPIANGNNKGVVITGAVRNTIGGATRATANYVVANSQEGVLASDRAKENIFLENFFGILPDGSPLGNGGNGMTVENGASDNEIGGDPPQPPIAARPSLIEPSGMTIANNGGAGIYISPTAGNGNQVNKVLTFANTGLALTSAATAAR